MHRLRSESIHVGELSIGLHGGQIFVGHELVKYCFCAQQLPYAHQVGVRNADDPCHRCAKGTEDKFEAQATVSLIGGVGDDLVQLCIMANEVLQYEVDQGDQGNKRAACLQHLPQV